MSNIVTLFLSLSPLPTRPTRPPSSPFDELTPRRRRNKLHIETGRHVRQLLHEFGLSRGREKELKGG